MGGLANRISTLTLLLLGAAALWSAPSAQAERVAGSLDTAPGFNLLGIPYPASDLGDILLAQASAGVSRVAAYDPASGAVLFCALGTSASPAGDGCSLAMHPGRGWFAEAPFADTRGFSIVIDCPALSLQPGNNLAAFPCADPALTAWGLLSRLGDGAAASLRRWDAASARWLSAGFLDGAPAGDDFALRPGPGYLLSMHQAATLLPPLANAGANQSVLLAAGEPVQLDAGASTDPDTPFAALDFAWTLQTPTGSTAALSATDTPATSFLPDLAGAYLAMAAVSDGSSRVTDPVRVYALDELTGDQDGDGVPNDQEIALGLDPFDPDSDGDGWPDGVELEVGTDPLDPNAQPGFALVAAPTVKVIRPSAADVAALNQYAGLTASPEVWVTRPAPGNTVELYRGLVASPGVRVTLPAPGNAVALYRGLVASPGVRVTLPAPGNAVALYRGLIATPPVAVDWQPAVD